MEYKRPTTVKELRRLIGLIGWYRRFIPKAAEILAPLSDLIKGDSKTKIEWTNEAEMAFTQVKEALTAAPILSSPDYSLPYKIYTDASLLAGAAVLTQEQNGIEKVIAYHSAKFSKTQLYKQTHTPNRIVKQNLTTPKRIIYNKFGSVNEH